MERLKKIGSVLGRSEMRKIMAGSGGCGDCSNYSCDSFCYCTHSGCYAWICQCSSGWTLKTCDGCWQGSGTYGGTICGGGCP